MLDYTIYFPKNLSQQSNSVTNILKQFNKLNSTMAPANVILNFTGTFFIGGEMTALVTAMVKILQEDGFTVKITKFQRSVGNILQRNGFLETLGVMEHHEDDKKTVIPLFVGYSQDENTIMKDYLNNKVFSFVQWPNKLHGKNHEIETINSAISETTRNISEHSGSNTVFMCGQFYPTLNHLRLTIVDTGVSIPINLRNHVEKLKKENDTTLLDWATASGNSTKDTIASGLGLFSIKENLVGEGEFTIISNNAFWKQSSSGTVIKKNMACTMPGTFIHLNFYLGSDKNNNDNYQLNDTINYDLLF
ncbi:hypothetical protein [Latilactobacillus sakei]|uniref:hypothetical protein n=1 Tax=Latilactobacillus sakei TaxID=1599 RepID=UPI000978099A|nr:hypothetical protein [Latilactobacillus sakei]